MEPAEQTVMQIARGYQLSQALYVAAKLGVADVLGPQPLAAEAIARAVGARIFGIVGRDGGFTGQVADACVIVPTASPDRVTPHTEGLCAVIWHLLVSHPDMKRAPAKWESTK